MTRIPRTPSLYCFDCAVLLTFVRLSYRANSDKMAKKHIEKFRMGKKTK